MIPDLPVYAQNNPGFCYVSDGDTNTISFPRLTAAKLGVKRSDPTLRVIACE
jgi:hypothetical protein